MTNSSGKKKKSKSTSRKASSSKSKSGVSTSKSSASSSTSASTSNAGGSTSVSGQSTSLIGASAKPQKTKSKSSKTGGKPLDGESTAETSNVAGRPKLCQNMGKVISTQGAIKLDSLKEMHKRGYTVDEEKKIGGQDYLMRAKGPDGKSMAAKLIHLKHCTPRYKITMERYSLKIMRFIGRKSPPARAFPRIYEIFLVDKVYYIFMGECGNKALYDLVTDTRHEITPSKARHIVQQLTDAVKELQKFGIAHRFIKLKHIMLTNANHSEPHIKIVGWSKSVLFWDTAKKKALYQHRERRARKNNFLPPEAFHRLYDPSKADVWAVGVVLIALTTRRYPFHVRARMKFTTQWRTFLKKHEMNPIVRSLANKIFVLDTRKRIHAREMLEHDYFKVEDKALTRKCVRGDSISNKGSKQVGDGDASKSYASFSNAGSTSKSEKSSRSGHKSKSSTSETSSKSRTSKLSKSDVGASQKGATSKTSSTSKSSKSTIEKSKSKPKAKKSGATLKSSKSATKPHSKSKSKPPKSAASKSKKSCKSATKTAGKKSSYTGKTSKGIGLKEMVSKQEMEAENDDAAADANQAKEEEAEPEIDKVDGEAGGEGADGELAAEGEEGQADEAEMAAPEEAADQANPKEMQADEGQQQDVDDAAAGQVVEAGVGAAPVADVPPPAAAPSLEPPQPQPPLVQTAPAPQVQQAPPPAAPPQPPAPQPPPQG